MYSIYSLHNIYKIYNYTLNAQSAISYWCFREMSDDNNVWKRRGWYAKCDTRQAPCTFPSQPALLRNTKHDRRTLACINRKRTMMDPDDDDTLVFHAIPTFGTFPHSLWENIYVISTTTNNNNNDK